MLAGKGHTFANDHRAAEVALEDVLHHARSTDDARLAGEALRMLSIVASNEGADERALRFLTESQSAYEVVLDDEGAALALGQLGAVLINARRFDDAREALEEAVQRFVSTGNRMAESTVRGNLAELAIVQGRLDAAQPLAVDALRITEEIDDLEGVTSSLVRLGDVARLLGDQDRARRQLELAVAAGRRHGLASFLAPSLASLAAIELADGAVDRAAAHVEEAGRAAEGSGLPYAAARVRFVTGLVERAAGRLESANETLRRAGAEHVELGLDDDRVECTAAQAEVLAAMGRLDDAHRLVAEVLVAVEVGAGVGTFEPGRALVDCHRVLVTGRNDALLSRLRGATERFLEERTSQIADDQVRQQLLRSPLGAALVALRDGER